MLVSRADNRCEAFTIAELLVVVGIVGVLVAIAVPTFLAQLENAKAATCMANCRVLKSTITTNYLTTQIEPDAAALAAAEEQLGSGLCPSGGTYSLKGSQPSGWYVKCSVHGSTEEDQLFEQLDTLFPPNTSYHELKEFLQDAGIISPGQSVGDQQLRQYYAQVNGMDSWTQIATDDKNKPLYLEFKSFGNNTGKVFLYAGSNGDPTQRDWSARYVYDKASGSWYDLGKSTGLAGVLTQESYDNLIATGTKVSLKDGSFVAS